MKICTKLILSALCVSLVSGSVLFAQARLPVTPSREVPAPKNTPQPVTHQPSTHQPSAHQPVTHSPTAHQPAAHQPVATANWGDYQALTSDAKKIFDKALGRQTGTVYTPLCVSTQPMNGKNYRFFCLGTTTGRQQQNKNAVVDILVDPAGHVKEKKITDIDQRNLPSGWSEFKPVDNKAKEVFAKTLSRHQNANQIPLCFSTSGTNYRFLCFCTDHSKAGNAVSTVNIDVRGNMNVADFNNFASENLQRTLQNIVSHAVIATSPTPQPPAPQPPAPVQKNQPQSHSVTLPRNR